MGKAAESESALVGGLKDMKCFRTNKYFYVE